MIWVLLLLATCGICAAFITSALSSAPVGHQDESGFNYGEKPSRVRSKVRPAED